MIVIVSWYADGSGQPEVTIDRVSYREGSGFSGHGALIEDIRNTRHKECRVWEVRDNDFCLLYDSAPSEKERKQ